MPSGARDGFPLRNPHFIAVYDMPIVPQNEVLFKLVFAYSRRNAESFIFSVKVPLPLLVDVVVLWCGEQRRFWLVRVARSATRSEAVRLCVPLRHAMGWTRRTKAARGEHAQGTRST
ncbi:hypothetical protein MRX96_045045 [Rhipicephalus microplus]